MRTQSLKSFRRGSGLLEQNIAPESRSRGVFKWTITRRDRVNVDVILFNQTKENNETISCTLHFDVHCG